MSDNGSNKMVVVCNHADPPHVMPTLIMGASGVGIGDDVILFFCPGGANALVKGELEKIRDMHLKGLPDPVKLYDDIMAEGGRVILCELALDFAAAHLKSGGSFLVKVFQGAGYQEYMAAMREVFGVVQTRKPEASRNRSSEVYLLGKNKR